MKNKIYLNSIIIVFLLLIQTGCATTAGKDAREHARMYPFPYEQVWAAVEDLIFNDLRCVPETVDRDKGIIETDWVHQIEAEGTVRWQLCAFVEQADGGVRVAIVKRVQMRDSTNQPSRYRKERNDPTNNAGWARNRIDTQSVEAYYRTITDKLR